MFLERPEMSNEVSENTDCKRDKTEKINDQDIFNWFQWSTNI